MAEDPRLLTLALDPVRAEIAVDVSAWPLTPGDEIRGKLVGPQCLFASTIEIAYPMRRKPGTSEYHVLIPEPSLWEPETPYVYGGRVEWWSGGKKVQEATTLHALLVLKNTPNGWRLNGKPFEPRIAEFPGADDAALRALHEEGLNVLRGAPAERGSGELAARHGFLWTAGDNQELSGIGLLSP